MTQKINTGLKCTFTVFNVFFTVVGSAVILLALLWDFRALAHNNWQEYVASRPTALCILGSIIMMTSILGACGAHNESKACLVTFLVLMIMGFLVILPFGILTAAVGPEVELDVEKDARNALPLNKASDEDKDWAETMQTTLQCCGLFSYKDWGGDLPASCLCSNTEQRCRVVIETQTGMRKSIYSQACVPISKHNSALFFNTLTAVFFSLAALALMGLILSSIMIHQMRNTPRPIMVSIPTFFTVAPPKYKELYNCPA